MLPDEEEFSPRVRAVYTSTGRIVGFQDPDMGNRFIRREDAIRILKYDSQEQSIVDSFGNRVGVGDIATPQSGYEVAYTFKTASFQPLGVDPLDFAPRPNQEVLERIVVTDPDGNLHTFETSYGLGKAFEPDTRGGWWRMHVSETRGLKFNERLSTRELDDFVVSHEFILKEIE